MEFNFKRHISARPVDIQLIRNYFKYIQRIWIPQ